MICESFARNDISDAYLSLDGYQLVVRQDGRDTVEGKCRGLLIYVKDSINETRLNIEQFNNTMLLSWRELLYHGEMGKACL